MMVFEVLKVSSRFKVKTVVHWDKSSASVSREKEDGWWWHGVVDSQGPDFRYTAEEMDSSAHLRDVAVMMMVRVGGQSDCQETEEQPADLNGNQRQSNQDDLGSLEDGNNFSVRLKLSMCIDF